MLRRLVVSAPLPVALGACFPSAAGAQQFLGTFRWQLAPFCNVITLNAESPCA